MIQFLVTSFLKDLASLSKNDFFSLGPEDRSAALPKVLGKDYPPSLSKYLVLVDSEQLEKDIKGALLWLRGNEVPVQGQGLLLAFNHYLVSDFAFALDDLPASFNALSLDDKEKSLGPQNGSQILLGSKKMITENDYHAIARAVGDYISQISAGQRLLIQTPQPLAAEDKKSMRRGMLEKHPNSFLNFTVEPSLLGGLRLFEGDTLKDASWLSRIKTLSTIVDSR